MASLTRNIPGVCLRKALISIDPAEDQPVSKPLVKTIIAAISVFIAKF
ncbi:uncharacterized protein RAG0_17262 [Rhynchosporium agropyri]|uniref:Uncharacterized protein n=3 Tax=Rhynchosporium TaxID=38037 RepID=A0A1E1M5D4_RHYSE|nr:uncharacterized protein RCO7_15101 [Rhynchosporium commune]CZT13765.1 uncharacterized protein RAG0_17262 [Rhynchosporium agropyri]CZT44301.1 uncharacterized protein RSE6_16050 [Rhynchosporium secalis]